jgi:large subunit ribosomal protein LP0
MGGKSGTKAVYFDKLKGLLDEYKSIFIVNLLEEAAINGAVC